MTFLGFMAVWVVVSIVTGIGLGALIRAGRGKEEDAA